ncbi:MAG TPA: hypothetical protein VGC30_06810 [Dokdonella sp.]
MPRGAATLALLLAGCANPMISASPAARTDAAPVRDVADDCAALRSKRFGELVALSPTVPAPAPPALAPKPAKGAAFLDADGTCIVRATRHDAEPPGQFARNDYSRREPFNADSSRVLVYGEGGYWHLYDARTLRYVERLNGPAGDAEPQWHPSDPNLLYYLPRDGGLKLIKLDVRKNASKTVAEFAGRLPWRDAKRLWTKSEGSPSRDGRYWGFQAETANFEIRGYVVYDLVEDKIVGTRSTSARPDHVSMTPSGRWFVSSGDGDGTWAWSPDFSRKKKLHHKSEHSDLAIGADGHDEYVSIDFQSDHGDVFFVDVDACPSVRADADAAATPECPRTVLFPTYLDGAHASFHFSGKAYAKPGWVLLSTYATSAARDGTRPWYADRLIAAELKPHPRLLALGHHESSGDAYWAEPHGAPNRDFTRAMFNSDWGRRGTNDIDDYLLVLPAAAAGR